MQNLGPGAESFGMNMFKLFVVYQLLVGYRAWCIFEAIPSVVQSFATAVPAPVFQPPAAAGTNYPDSFATAKHAAGSAIPGTAYAEVNAFAPPSCCN